MKKLFPGYYRPSDRELANLWKTCIFVLDANVFLNLYRYPKAAREDLLKVLNQISDRLWVPHQAALEYQQNRLTTITEQVRRFDEVRELLNSTMGELRNGLMQLQLRKRHSAINPDGLLAKLDSTVDDFLGDLSKLEKGQPDVFSEDKLRTKIDALLKGKVGPSPASQAELDAIYQEGKTRFDNKIPPGYKDTAKGKPSDKELPYYIYNDLLFRREYGDLLVWYEIIQAAKKLSWKKVVFVTDDKKEDWWWIVESKGDKTIGPRPQLIEEISAKAGVATFYMYNSDRFLEFAKKYLRAEVEQESIEQVREITQLRKRENDPKRSPQFYSYAEHAVLEWLQELYPKDEVIIAHYGFPDFMHVDQKNNARVGYDVKYFGRAVPLEHIMFRMRDVGYRGFYEIQKGNFTELKIVIVLETSQSDEAERIYKNPRFETPHGVSYIFGTLVETTDKASYRFVPFFETKDDGHGE